MRFFNTAGPVDAELHYQIPPLTRLNLNNLMQLIQQRKYFILHAPRQTGKTSALVALRDRLNESGEYRCVYVNVELDQSDQEDVETAMRTILSSIALAADNESLDRAWLEALTTTGPHFALQKTLALWSESEPKPIVLMIDNIDALVGDTLLAVLRQLRAGYTNRPNHFPQSVILCGVRDVCDVRDYHIDSTAGAAIVPDGVFNVSAKSLRLTDFSPSEVESLLAQHTEATGQGFAEEAYQNIWNLTQGQPWLVNALAHEACFKSKAGQDHSKPILSQAIQDARQQLILRRETHLDQLADNLCEERVQRVIQPLLTGTITTDPITNDDLQYVRDLGLVTEQGSIAIANPIYRDLIFQVLSPHSEALTA
ncbi:MAG: AAA-like domain-containing protein [Gammaproteobacteria bacterium]|nr:AAA-like domain-containing protein [Gammaproteobacteria bacterium]